MKRNKTADMGEQSLLTQDIISSSKNEKLCSVTNHPNNNAYNCHIFTFKYDFVNEAENFVMLSGDFFLEKP